MDSKRILENIEEYQRSRTMTDPTDLKNIVDIDNVIRTPSNERKMSSNKRKMSSDMIPGQSYVIKMFKWSKTQPGTLCQCMEKCSERLTDHYKNKLLNFFVEMDSKKEQNTFLLKLIKARPVSNRLFSNETANGKLLRRIYCKYKIPYFLTEDFMLNINYESDNDEESGFNKTSSVASSKDSKRENNKSLECNSMESSRKLFNRDNWIGVCEEAFTNLFRISDKRLKTVKELLRVKTGQKHMKRMIEKREKKIELSLAKDLAQSCVPLMLSFSDEDKKKVSDLLLTAINSDVHLISNFFYNQLWKPEYINPQVI